MLIFFLKFFHVILALSLFGLLFYSIKTIGTKKFSSQFFHRGTVGLVFLSLITGTLLIYPKHFTFHTPWINAAYLLVFIFLVGIFFLKKLQQKIIPRIILQIGYLSLFILLMVVVHDAVTKTTFLPF